MSFKTKITYTLAKWGLLLAGIGCVFYAASLLFKVFRPYKKMEPNHTDWSFGIGDYNDKGIPIIAGYPTMRIPVDSFAVTSDVGPVFKQENPGVELQPSAKQSSEDFHPANDITTVKIDQFTFYAWPKSVGQRLFLLLPNLLTWLAIAFCAWQLSKFMRDVVQNEAFRKNASARLAYVGFSIIGVQIAFLLWGFMQPYGPYINIINAFNQGLTMQAEVHNPFSIQWFGFGLIILIIAKGFQYGSDLQEEHDLIN